MSENEQKYDTDGNWCGRNDLCRLRPKSRKWAAQATFGCRCVRQFGNGTSCVQFDHLPSVEEKQAVQEAIRKLGYEPLSLQQKI